MIFSLTVNENITIKSRPELVAVKAFAITILAGAFLLAIPFANSEGKLIDPLTALFTSTSATCVTGLTVVDTGSTFSLFGQLVILCLIQMGGIGIMTLGTFLLTLVGRRLKVENEFVILDALGHKYPHRLKEILLHAVIFTFTLELIGAVILTHRLTAQHGYPLFSAIYYSVFHAVSAFCNAGFSLYPDNLICLRTDKVVILTIAFLVILGGFGFIVLHNFSCIKIWRRDRIKRGRFSLHTRIVLTASAILILFGWIVFTLLEWNNSLAQLSWLDKITCGLFQSITPRTAGFNVVDIAQIKPQTRFMTLLFMFIGGSPASTAGGIKTTTIAVLAFTVWTMIKGRHETVIGDKTIPATIVREAITIFMLSISCVLVFFSVLLTTEHPWIKSLHPVSTDALLFEIVSAFGTVGLSTGITPYLSAAGKLCLVICMFIGRLGPLSIALIIGTRDPNQILHYPEEHVVVG